MKPRGNSPNEFESAMKISKQERRDAKQLFRSCMSNGLLDDTRVREAVRAVLAGKPRGYLGILTQFQRLVKLDIERRTARVESPVPLTAEQQDGIEGNLTRKYGPGLYFAFGQDPSLIAGLRIQVGSDVYDGSVQARLENLRETF
jgi:F-type H+-transporting ATPase subunit delta